MEQNRLAVHETIELHELLSFKTLCMTKSKAMQALVSDAGLKALMQEDIDQSIGAVRELKGLLATAKPQ
jgi:similar to spore coat protein